MGKIRDGGVKSLKGVKVGRVGMRVEGKISQGAEDKDSEDGGREVFQLMIDDLYEAV